MASEDEKNHVGYYLGLEAKDYPAADEEKNETEKRTQLSFADDEQEREFHRQAVEMQAILDKRKPTPAEEERELGDRSIWMKTGEETTIRRLVLDPETGTYKTMSVSDLLGKTMDEIETAVKAAEMEALLKDAPLVRRGAGLTDTKYTLMELSVVLHDSYEKDHTTTKGTDLFDRVGEAYHKEIQWADGLMRKKEPLTDTEKGRVTALYTLLADRKRISDPKCSVAKECVWRSKTLLDDMEGIRYQIDMSQSVPQETGSISSADTLTELADLLSMSYQKDLEINLPAGHPLFAKFCEAHLQEINWVMELSRKPSLDDKDRARVVAMYALLADRNRIPEPKCHVAKHSVAHALPQTFQNDTEGIEYQIRMARSHLRRVYVTEEQAKEFAREHSLTTEGGQETFAMFEQIAASDPTFKWASQIRPKMAPQKLTVRIAQLYPEFQGMEGMDVILEPRGTDGTVSEEEVFVTPHARKDGVAIGKREKEMTHAEKRAYVDSYLKSELPDGAVARTGAFEKYEKERMELFFSSKPVETQPPADMTLKKFEKPSPISDGDNQMLKDLSGLLSESFSQDYKFLETGDILIEPLQRAHVNELDWIASLQNKGMTRIGKERVQSLFRLLGARDRIPKSAYYYVAGLVDPSLEGRPGIVAQLDLSDQINRDDISTERFAYELQEREEQIQEAVKKMVPVVDDEDLPDLLDEPPSSRVEFKHHEFKMHTEVPPVYYSQPVRNTWGGMLLSDEMDAELRTVTSDFATKSKAFSEAMREEKAFKLDLLSALSRGEDIAGVQFPSHVSKEEKDAAVKKMTDFNATIQSIAAKRADRDFISELLQKLSRGEDVSQLEFPASISKEEKAMLLSHISKTTEADKKKLAEFGNMLVAADERTLMNATTGAPLGDSIRRKSRYNNLRMYAQNAYDAKRNGMDVSLVPVPHMLTEEDKAAVDKLVAATPAHIHTLPRQLRSRGPWIDMEAYLQSVLNDKPVPADERFPAANFDPATRATTISLFKKLVKDEFVRGGDVKAIPIPETMTQDDADRAIQWVCVDRPADAAAKAAERKKSVIKSYIMHAVATRALGGHYVTIPVPDCMTDADREKAAQKLDAVFDFIMRNDDAMEATIS